jgi:hypothetical protein
MRIKYTGNRAIISKHLTGSFGTCTNFLSTGMCFELPKNFTTRYGQVSANAIGEIVKVLEKERGIILKDNDYDYLFTQLTTQDDGKKILVYWKEDYDDEEEEDDDDW